MTLRDRLLPAVNRIRGLRGRFGLTTITVKLLKRTWTGDINTTGATSGDDIVLMSPQPKVRKASEEVSLFYGAGPADRVAGSPTLDVYEIGPITPAHTAGGYSVLNLLRDVNPTAARQCLLTLAGDGIGDTATTDVLFELVKVDASTPLHTTIIVRQAAQTP